jgi:hypothetical protein
VRNPTEPDRYSSPGWTVPFFFIVSVPFFLLITFLFLYNLPTRRSDGRVSGAACAGSVRGGGRARGSLREVGFFGEMEYRAWWRWLAVERKKEKNGDDN